MEVKEILYKEAIDFVLPKHYSGRKPVVSIAFGLFDNNRLIAVCTFGKPASNSLCKGIAGDKYTSNVYELNRLCRIDEIKYPMSKFVGECLRLLKSKDWIIVSYADSGMTHVGYIYQACNFLYTGATAKRTDKYTEGNKHSRHYDNDKQGTLRKVRTSKHRYVFVCASSKAKKKELTKAIKYKVLPYPKGEIKKYILGDFQKPTIIDTANN